MGYCLEGVWQEIEEQRWGLGGGGDVRLGWSVGVVVALEKWKGYLLDRHFKIRTDHFSLKYLLNQKLTTPFKLKWLPKLLGYDYEINYKKGNENGKVKDNWKDDIDAKNLIHSLLDHSYKGNKFNWIDDVLKRKWKVVVGSILELRKELIKYFHNKSIRGHSGVHVTTKKLSAVFIGKDLRRCASQVAQVFMDNVYKLHRLPESTVSDRDKVFMSGFWKALFAELKVKLKFSIAYHPQTDGQTEEKVKDNWKDDIDAKNLIHSLVDHSYKGNKYNWIDDVLKRKWKVKEYQEKDKIGSKPEKREAWQSRKKSKAITVSRAIKTKEDTKRMSANSLLEEFANELALITYSSDYDDNHTCDIESDLREIEFLLYQGEDSDLKDSSDKTDLANLNDLFVDPTPEMFTDEQPPDYSFPSRFDVSPDDFLEIESDANNCDNDSFDSKGEKIKEAELLIDQLDLPCDIFPLSEYDSFNSQDFSRDDDLPLSDNEDKVFNPGILIHEKSVKIITRVAQEKKLGVSFASLLFEDFDPPIYVLLVFKEVPNSMRLLPFSSENEEKVFKLGIYTSNKVKEYQEKDKIGSKPDKNGKRGEVGKSQKQLQSVEQEKLKKTQKEGEGVEVPMSERSNTKDLRCNSYITVQGPILDKVKSFKISRTYNSVYKLHRLPESTVSDRDKVFMSGFWKALFAELKVKFKFSIAYHPQTGGQTEVVNRFLGCYQMCTSGKNQRNESSGYP
nr:reverse transcriptase [Tanacetum cinerariifolium]